MKDKGERKKDKGERIKENARFVAPMNRGLEMTG
jgi:hypothetical protein